MNNMQKQKYRKRLLPALMAGFTLALALTGCGNEGKLDEGDCKCAISFVDIPKELSMSEENVQNSFAIRLTLQSISNEKYYHISLDRANNYSEEISLHPGIYRVLSPSTNQSSNLQLEVKADVESVELSEDTPASIHVYVSNPEEFTRHWMSVQPMPEMLLAEKFDGLLQVNRQVFDLRTEDSGPLISQFNLSYDKQVPAYGKVELHDSDAGVTLTLQNQTASPADWQSCKVVGIYVTKNNIVFPQGVTLGMAPAAVCHKKDGLYGEPDKLTGSLLLGWGFDNTCAIYNDPESGDKITLDLGSGNSSIVSIRYELAQYE